MEIIFLNTLNAQLTESISDFILGHAKTADMFCLQEAFHTGTNMHEVCRRLLPEFECVEAEKELDNEDCFGQATYIRRKHQVLNSQVIFANDPDIGLGLITEIEINGKPLAVCNFHGVSKPGSKKDTEARIKQSQRIIEAMGSYGPRRIIGGDFNLDMDTHSVRVFSECGYRNLIVDYNIKTTRNRIAWDMYPETPQLYADFVFASQGVQIESFEVPDIVISDHQPMILHVNNI